MSENSPHLRREMNQIHRAQKTTKRRNLKKTTPKHIIIQDKGRILKEEREK